MRRISRLLAVLLGAGVLLAAGCGGDEDEDGGDGAATPAATEEPAAGGEALVLTADPDGAIAWDKSELTAPAGTVTIRLINDSDVPHAVQIEGGGVDEASETVTGAETEVTAELEAGEYEFFCPVGQHASTMNGTLTVE